MKISTLRIEPHRVKPDISEHYVDRTTILWTIWVDETLITQRTYPFALYDSVIELYGNANVPIFGDGDDYLSVRCLGKFVIWSELLPTDIHYILNDASIPEMYLFSLEQYAEACSNALKDGVPPFFQQSFLQKPKSEWKVFSEEDLKYLIQGGWPDMSSAIYRNPTNYLDKTGTITMRRMQYAIKAMTDFTICDPPEKQIELRIGLDEAEFTEAIWRIGKVNGQFAILFEQHPYFPLWLQSEAFDKVLSSEPFAKEL